MTRPRKLPSDRELLYLKESGMTHAEIAEHIALKTGEPVARSTVSVALSRAGFTNLGRRYKEEVPWVVKSRHHSEYPVRMLRALGRRRSGTDQNEDEAKRLDGWLDRLESQDLIVAYCYDAPDNSPGFVYITAAAKDHDLDIPHRQKIVKPEEVGYTSSTAA